MKVKLIITYNLTKFNDKPKHKLVFEHNNKISTLSCFRDKDVPTLIMTYMDCDSGELWEYVKEYTGDDVFNKEIWYEHSSFECPIKDSETRDFIRSYLYYSGNNVKELVDLLCADVYKDSMTPVQMYYKIGQQPLPSKLAIEYPVISAMLSTTF